MVSHETIFEEICFKMNGSRQTDPNTLPLPCSPGARVKRRGVRFNVIRKTYNVQSIFYGGSSADDIFHVLESPRHTSSCKLCVIYHDYLTKKHTSFSTTVKPLIVNTPD